MQNDIEQKAASLAEREEALREKEAALEEKERRLNKLDQAVQNMRSNLYGRVNVSLRTMDIVVGVLAFLLIVAIGAGVLSSTL